MKLSTDKILKILFSIIVISNLVLSAWFVLQSDVEFNWEIARDFFLLDEIERKKIVLIGPSSTTGLFHGPLWTYVNYPAYALGGGDPVVVGIGWLFFIAVFLASSFYIAKILFDSKTAYFFVLMLSVYCVFHAKSFYNPHGAMFIIPAFFFFLVRYAQTYKIKFLIAHVLLSGILIQFQMAIGIPFLILSFLYALFLAIRKHKKRHLSVYLLIVITLANFFVFDLRHEFLLSKLTLRFLSSPGNEVSNILSMLHQRISFMTAGVEFLRADSGYRNLVLFLIFSFFLFIQIKDKKYKLIYFTFLYFYFGFLLLSNLNAGGLLYFYLFPLFPLVFLIFSSFVTSRYSTIFILLFLAIFFMNEQTAINDIRNAQNNFIGKSPISWLFLKNASGKVFEGKEREFGYFVYHPDIIAYQPKYAMHYRKKQSAKNAHYFQKKPITYLFIAPPPQDNPYMKDDWWKVNLLHIKGKPQSSILFDNGYKIEKYTLTENEVAIPVEPGVDPGIHFR